MEIFPWIKEGGLYVVGVIMMAIIAWISDLTRRSREHGKRIEGLDKKLAVVSAGVELLVETEGDHGRKLDSLLAQVSEIRGICSARRSMGGCE